MAGIIQFPWTRQPQIRVRQSRADPLGNALNCVWLGNNLSGIDYFKGLIAGPPAGTAILPTSRGIALTNTGTAGAQVAIPVVNFPYVQVAYGYFNSSGNSWGLSALNYSGAGTSSDIRIFSSTAVEFLVRYNFGTSQSISCSVGTINAGAPVCAIVVVYSATDYRLFVNGVQANGTVSPGTNPGLDRVYPPASSVVGLNGGVWLTGYGQGRAIDDSLALKITGNPEQYIWQIFQPLTRRLWAPSGAADILMAQACL